MLGHDGHLGKGKRCSCSSLHRMKEKQKVIASKDTFGTPESNSPKKGSLEWRRAHTLE